MAECFICFETIPVQDCKEINCLNVHPKSYMCKKCTDIIHYCPLCKDKLIDKLKEKLSERNAQMSVLVQAVMYLVSNDKDDKQKSSNYIINTVGPLILLELSQEQEQEQYSE